MWASEFQVVRLWPGTKRPVDKGYQLPANRMTPAQAEEAWARNPQMNLGVIPASGGCVVVDLDGADAIAWFLDRYGPRAFDTLAVRSPRQNGGMHLWYRAPAEKVWWRGKLAGRPDVDLKANGFVLLPPSSKFPEGPYRWVRGGKPEPIPADVLADAVHDHEPPEAAELGDAEGWVLDLVASAMRGAGQGDRNNTLYGLARDFGPSDELRRAAREAGLDDEEIERTLQSAKESHR